MDSDIKSPERLGQPEPEPSAGSKTQKDEPKHNTAFRTPDEVAAADDLQQPVELNDSAGDKHAKNTARSSGSWRDKLALHWPPGKKEWLVAAAVVIIGLGVFLVVANHKQPVASVTKPAKTKSAPKPATVPSTLSGLPVDPSVNKRPVTAIMVENSLQARPQSGLGQSMVVFEAVAEGGVTRFMALYQDTQPNNVGPIRSVRPYYEQWALGFDAAIAHVGGSPDGLADLKSWNVRDLDQFHNSGYYHRISSRAAPHNVYTSISRLNQLENSKGYTSSTFTGFPRKKESPSKQPTARSISLTMSGPAYNVHYDYAPKINAYKRSEGGSPQTDANTNTQLTPKVVIAMVIPEKNGALDTSGAYYSDYAVIGSGPVYVFQDGTVTTGQWAKSSSASQITFTDSTGKPIDLDPGQTWLTAINATNKISYSP